MAKKVIHSNNLEHFLKVFLKILETKTYKSKTNTAVLEREQQGVN